MSSQIQESTVANRTQDQPNIIIASQPSQSSSIASRGFSLGNPSQQTSETRSISEIQFRTLQVRGELPTRIAEMEAQLLSQGINQQELEQMRERSRQNIETVLTQTNSFQGQQESSQPGNSDVNRNSTLTFPSNRVPSLPLNVLSNRSSDKSCCCRCWKWIQTNIFDPLYRFFRMIFCCKPLSGAESLTDRNTRINNENVHRMNQ